MHARNWRDGAEDSILPSFLHIMLGMFEWPLPLLTKLGGRANLTFAWWSAPFSWFYRSTTELFPALTGHPAATTQQPCSLQSPPDNTRHVRKMFLKRSKVQLPRPALSTKVLRRGFCWRPVARRPFAPTLDKAGHGRYIFKRCKRISVRGSDIVCGGFLSQARCSERLRGPRAGFRSLNKKKAASALTRRCCRLSLCQWPSCYNPQG